MASETIDPDLVPGFTLRSGARMPGVGLGTFGSDRYSAEQIAAAVRGTAAVGYRHFDCAAVYGNEREVGAALAEVMKSGIAREELWITSKLWNDKHGEADVIPAFEQSLADLGLEYLDLYLIHWPFPNFHPPGCDVDSRSPDAVSFDPERYLKTWRQLERLVERGLVRHLGTSNMTIPKLEAFLPSAEIPPACNELELHPHFQQPELFEYCVARSIQPIAFSPIGSPSRPERDRTPEDTTDIEDPVIVTIAERLGVHPAVVCIKWALQRGAVPIPFSVRPEQYLANLAGCAGDPLTAAEMEAIAGIDRNCRLIKGQVFLWKEGQSWEDLWDLRGEITPP